VELAERIAALDPTLFDTIASETTRNDRRSLLALHQACADDTEGFAYLEIGSHLGGSLQVLVRDPRCRRIVSIDARPLRQPDERGPEWRYRENSTERMRGQLGALPDADLGKLETIDASTADIDPASIAPPPTLCFVDGEHTDDAVLRDARFCRQVISDDGWLAFHDTGIVYGGLTAFLEELADEGVEHRSYFLPDSIVAVELGEPRLLKTKQVVDRIIANAEGYLSTLRENDRYRAAALNRPLSRLLRRTGLSRVYGS
jgi:Methyltransferase domain